MDIKNKVVAVEVVYRFEYVLADWGTYFEDKSESETKQTLEEDALESIRDGAALTDRVTAEIITVDEELKF